MFYFFIAGIHDCGQMMASLGPYVIMAFLNINSLRISATWCKLRFFLATSFSAIPLSCCCAAAFDQYLTTSRNARVRQWSSMKTARWISLVIVIVWWLHGSLWLYFQDMSPIYDTCYYISNEFHLYGIIFVLVILCVAHMFIMSLFTYLCYQNVKNINAITTRNIDRQMIRMVGGQVLLTVIGLTPFSMYVAYDFATMNVLKDNYQAEIEALVNSITYILCFIPYAVCFYR